jgi:hypothetical protein
MMFRTVFFFLCLSLSVSWYQYKRRLYASSNIFRAQIEVLRRSLSDTGAVVTLFSSIFVCIVFRAHAAA